MTNHLPRMSLMVLALAAAAGTGPLTAQDKSASLAKELTTLMQSRKIDSVAARHPAAADQFVAALTFPGQLMVVWARTTAPAILNEKLLRSEYRDVYIDLNSASIPASRVMITDGGADGLKARREANAPIDFHDANGKGIRFSGNWRENKMSEQDYMKAYADAQQAYVVALEALLTELKKTS